MDHLSPKILDLENKLNVFVTDMWVKLRTKITKRKIFVEELCIALILAKWSPPTKTLEHLQHLLCTDLQDKWIIEASKGERFDAVGSWPLAPTLYIANNCSYFGETYARSNNGNLKMLLLQVPSGSNAEEEDPSILPVYLKCLGIVHKVLQGDELSFSMMELVTLPLCLPKMEKYQEVIEKRLELSSQEYNRLTTNLLNAINWLREIINCISQYNRPDQLVHSIINVRMFDVASLQRLLARFTDGWANTEPDFPLAYTFSRETLDKKQALRPFVGKSLRKEVNASVTRSLASSICPKLVAPPVSEQPQQQEADGTFVDLEPAKLRAFIRNFSVSAGPLLAGRMRFSVEREWREQAVKSTEEIRAALADNVRAAGEKCQRFDSFCLLMWDICKGIRTERHCSKNDFRAYLLCAPTVEHYIQCVDQIIHAMVLQCKPLLDRSAINVDPFGDWPIARRNEFDAFFRVCCLSLGKYLENVKAAVSDSGNSSKENVVSGLSISAGSEHTGSGDQKNKQGLDLDQLAATIEYRMLTRIARAMGYGEDEDPSQHDLITTWLIVTARIVQCPNTAYDFVYFYQMLASVCKKTFGDSAVSSTIGRICRKFLRNPTWIAMSNEQILFFLSGYLTPTEEGLQNINKMVEKMEERKEFTAVEITNPEKIPILFHAFQTHACDVKYLLINLLIIFKNLDENFQ